MTNLIITRENQLTANNNSIEIFNSFLDYYRDKSEATIRAYFKNLNTFNSWLIENDINPLELTRDDILDFKEYLILTNHKATTINSYLNTIRQLTRWLTFKGYYSKNPYEAISSEKLSHEFRKSSLTLDQVKTILKSFKRDTPKSKRDFAIMCLLLTTGLRTIELERALIGDIETALDSKILYVLGKGRKEKNEYVKLSIETEKAINEYLETRLDRNNPNAPLFTSESNHKTNKALPKESISRIVKTTFRSLGLDSERLTAHSCRHTTATLNLKNGGTLEETKELLRHSNISTTMIYAHIIDRENNKSEERLSSLYFNDND